MSEIDSLTSWQANWRGRKIVILGVGVSGFSVADTLQELGADLQVIADQIDEQHQDLLNVLGVSFQIENSDEKKISLARDFSPELVITSPGVKPSNPLLQWAKSESIPIWGDIELAWRLRDKAPKLAKWILITGTNGKTTTTQLVEHMLNTSGSTAIACGNIGTPVLDVIRNPEVFDYYVVELSSFQLHYMENVVPFVSAILNIAEDHIDWHGSFEEYTRAKAKVYAGTQQAVIYNVEDSLTMELVQQADVASEETLAVGFTKAFPADLQVGFIEESLIDRAFFPYRAKELPEIANLSDVSQIGVVTPHLLSNIAAATAIARACTVEPEHIRSAIRSFKLDHHRIELVAEESGVLYIDDSKATNAHAAAASLAAFDSVIWILGGLLKGVDIAPLIKSNASKLKAAIVIGADRAEVLQKLKDNAPAVQVVEISEADNQLVMARAIEAARSVAAEGDVVLLAPAAASMDQFKDYADRGMQFAKAVTGDK